jgi:hypothetical protein
MSEGTGKCYGLTLAQQLLCSGLVSVSVFLVGAISASSAQAQQGTPLSANQPTPQELAKSVHNPFDDFIDVAFQSTTGFDLGPHHNAGEALNIQPTIPYSLNSQWDLILRPSLSAIYLPSPHEQYGLQDLQTSIFLTPDWATKWVWGVGPIFQFPTGTSKELGTGRWSAGPTAALIYDEGPWFGGVLTYQLMSFAGDRGRGSVNQTYIEPEVSYNSESGWYVDCDPQMTYDWTADIANVWVIPIGADVGKTFKIGTQNMGLQFGSYDLAKHPDGAPQWIIRVQLTLLFPTGR